MVSQLIALHGSIDEASLTCIVGKPVCRPSGKLGVGLGRFKDKERSDVRVGRSIVGSEGLSRELNSRSGRLVVSTPARSVVGSPSVMLKVGITPLGSVIPGEIVGSDNPLGIVTDRSGKVIVGTDRSEDSPGNMSVGSASVGRDKLPGSEMPLVSVAKTEPISEVGSPGSIDRRDDGTSGMRSDTFNMPVNTVTVNGGGTKVTVTAHSDRDQSALLSLHKESNVPDSASSPDPWASTPLPAKTKAKAKRHLEGENRCIVTDKTSLLENEGNAQNPFPSQQVDIYQCMLRGVCCDDGRRMSVAWYETSGLIAQQIS